MTHPIDILRDRYPGEQTEATITPPSATAKLPHGVSVYLYTSRDHMGSTNLCTISVAGTEMGWAHERSPDEALDKAAERAGRKFAELLRGKP
jgi:hypothetical protein